MPSIILCLNPIVEPVDPAKLEQDIPRLSIHLTIYLPLVEYRTRFSGFSNYWPPELIIIIIAFRTSCGPNPITSPVPNHLVYRL